MSNIIPPLLSSSPPPMIGAVLEDDDDEFGSFAIASDLHCDSDAPSSTPEEICITDIPITIDDVNDLPELCSNTTNIENRSKIKGNTTSTKYNSFQYFPDIPPDILLETNETLDLNDAVDSSNAQFLEISEILDKKLDINEAPPSPPPPLAQVEDFADFHAFTDAPLENFTEAEVDIAANEEDDDFGDFNDYSFQTEPMQSVDIDDVPRKAETVVNEMFPIIQHVTEEYLYEDFTFNNVTFTQLKDITDTCALSYQWSKSNSQNFLLRSLNIDTRNILYGPRWNESMPRYAATLGYTPLEPVKSDGESGEILPQTDIPSAEFDWVGSGLTNPLENSPASTMLLDLEQLVASLEIQYSSSRTPKSQNSPSQIDDIDDWEFWLRLTPKKIVERRPMDFVDSENSRNIDKNIEIPSLTQTQSSDDNESIKSLKFNDNTPTEKNDLDDFNCFQSNKTEFDWPPSLRETHISNVKADEPSWLKPTILTPDLPRKSSKCEEDFADFQSGTCDDVPEHTAVTMMDTKSTTEDDDEFTEFQSTICLPPQLLPIIPEPLQPSILQPTKAAAGAGITTSSTTINWPDPGITDEELRSFSLSYKPSATETGDVKKTSDEDDWSDFVSNEIPNHKLPQNGFQTSLVSNQYVVLAAHPDEVDDEWSDFVSSEPSARSEIPSRLTQPPVSKLNLDWNGPPQFSSWSTSVTPNIITNPASFESFQTFTSFDGDLLKSRIANKKNPSIMIHPRKNTVPSISTIPDLEFIAPKNRTWKK